MNDTNDQNQNVGYEGGYQPRQGNDNEPHDPNMNGYQPDGYQPNGYQPNGYQPNGYQPNGYQPNGYQPNGYQPNGYQPNGYQPNGYQPNGYQPNGYQPNGYQPNGYQPNGYQPNGYQPNGYQPDGYQANGYQPNGYQQPNNGYQQGGYQQHNDYQQQAAYQQPAYGQPVVAASLKATEDEKEAYFSSASSIFMLIFCIAMSINIVPTIISNVLSLKVFDIFNDFILDALMIAGLWVTYIFAVKKKLSPKGLALFKVPFIIGYVFSIFEFVGNVIAWSVTLNILGLCLGIATFVLHCVMYSSVKKTLDVAIDINDDKNTKGQKSGKAAAIIIIVSASFTLISTIVNSILSNLIMGGIAANLPQEFESIFAFFMGTANSFTFVAAGVAFLVNIAAAIVLLQFAKKLDVAHGNQQ